MNKVKQASAVIVGLLCLATLPATAQKNGKALGKAVEATVGRKVAQQTVKKLNYDPVLGYESFRYKVPGSHNSYINTTLKEGKKMGLTTARTFQMVSEDSPFQTAPITNPEHANKSFMTLNELKGPRYLYGMPLTRLTQALYLWRLSFIGRDLDSDISQIAKSELENLWTEDISELADAPTVLFLKRLLDPKFEPKSYTELLEQTPVYPKHVVLNEQGFPVHTVQADQARILDSYLLMAKKDRKLNNAFPEDNDYNVFVLTPEERAAAYKLLALREQGDAIPANPTPRQLLENIYNQMEREVIPYNAPLWGYINSAAMDDYFYESENPFEGTPIWNAMQNMLEKAGGDLAWQQSYDMAHLMVVTKILTSPWSDGYTISYWENFFKAFKRIWNETPATSQNIAHLKILQNHVASHLHLWGYSNDKDAIRDLGYKVATWKK